VGVTIFKRLRIALRIAVITLVVLEIALRVVGMNNPVLYMSDKACGYRHKPVQSVRFLGNGIFINSLGLRDAREFETKHEGMKRILVLGDSVTWGGVTLRDSELFTWKLERSMPQTEVINAGVNGYSVEQMVSLYESHLADLRPDVILVYCIIGDFLRPPITDLAGNSTAFPTEKPWLAISRSIAMSRLQIASMTGWEWLRPYSGTVSRDGEHSPGDRNAANIATLNRLRDALTPQQELLVVISPQMMDAAANETSNRIVSSLNEQHFETIDLRNENPRQDWFIDGTHLSTKGHAWVAEQLAKRLKHNPPITVTPTSPTNSPKTSTPN
jgi:lysophospholipase L1-like esterase